MLGREVVVRLGRWQSWRQIEDKQLTSTYARARENLNLKLHY